MDKKSSLIGKVEIGTKVKILASKYEGLTGTLKYIGPLQGNEGQWIGVQLDQEKGSHSGDYKGHVYFSCKKNHGMFVKARNIGLIDGTCFQELLKDSYQPTLSKQETKPSKQQTAKVTQKKQVTKIQTEKNQSSTATKKQQNTPTIKPPIKKQTKKQTKTVPTARNPTTTASKLPDKKKQSKAPTVSQKLSNQLNELQNLKNQKIAALQQQLAKAEEQISILKERPLNQQNDSLKQELARLTQSYRVLTNQKDKIQHKVTEGQQSKYKQLESQINFYKSEKQKSQKEKKRMEKRLQKLQEQLNQVAEYEQLIQKLSEKCQNLESKNQALRIELQNAKTELKNSKITGSKNAGSSSTTNSDQNVDQLLEQITTLNQTIVLLQSELNKQVQKRQTLEKQTEGSVAKLSQLTKLEKKLKIKQAEIVQLKQTLEQHSEAVVFAQTISLKKMKIQEQLQVAKAKINELINEKDYLEQVQQSHEQLTQELEHEVNNKEFEIEKLQQVIKDKDAQIQDHLKQIGKYKQKLSELLQKARDNNTKNELQTSIISVNNTSVNQTFYNNAQYIKILKYAETINQKYIKIQNQFSIIKNKAGVFLLNILESLPQQFTEKFYPEGIELLVIIKTAKDKLYYLFDQIFNQLREKNQLYSQQNADLSNWMIMIFIKIQKIFHRLYRLELLLSSCETQEQLAEIVTRRIIKEQAQYIDVFASELLVQFAENSISAATGLERLDQTVKILQQENNAIIKPLSKQQDTKINLCIVTMKCITYSCEMILNYRLLAQLKQNAQIDLTFQNFLRKLAEYLKQICLNQHIRYKPRMANYLQGLNFISQLYKQIQSQNLIMCLQNLNDKKQQINILKDTILTVQTYLKQLLADLDDLNFNDELKKFKTKLQGKLWQNKIEFINAQLLKVKQLADQKVQLEADLIDTKKKLFIQQKQLKDKSTVRDLLEKRIGQLQLKVQQVTVLENQIKRFKEQIRNAEQGNRAMEQQIQNLLKKKSQNEEQIKKLKEKLDTQATQIHAKQQQPKVQSSSFMNVNSIPVKKLLQQNSALRNCQLKQKINQLKYSQVFQASKISGFDQYKSIRKSALESLVDIKIQIPGDNKNQENVSDKLYLTLEKIIKQKKQKQRVKLIDIGSVWVNKNSNDSKTTIGKFRYNQLQNILPEIIQI